MISEIRQVPRSDVVRLTHGDTSTTGKSMVIFKT